LSWGIDVNGDVHIRYDQNTGLNDNSYGTGAIGWTNGHSFGNLTGSDKAEFILTDGLGTKVLDFFQDYITLQNAAPFTPSHYASLGATGGDGSLVTGNSAWVMNPDSSLAKNLNKFCVNAGCTTLVQGVALTVNSPAADANYNTSNPFFNGWNFVDSFEVTVSHLAFGANGFGAVAVGLVHNSPAKAGTNAITPGDCGTGGGGTGQLVITGKKLDKTEVQITIQNNTGADVFLSGVQLTWPAVNGKLMQVKVGGGVVYDNPDIAPPSANLTMAQLVADQNKRKIPKGTSVVLHLVFEHNVDKNPGNYTGTLTFTNGMTLTILP
jgi:hypothetical protein